MRILRIVVSILACFIALVWLFRLPARESVPATAPSPPPPVEQVQAAAESFQYRRGVHGGELRLNLGDDPQTFNMVLSTDAVTSTLLGWLYEGLLTRNRVTYELEPRLAAAMPEPVDEAGLVWEVTLRDDVTWFDGEPLTADDVVFTMNRIVYNNDIPTSSRFAWQLEDTDPATGRPVVRQVKVERVDRFRVRYTLPFRWAYFFDTLGQEIYPRHVLEPSVIDGRFSSMWDKSVDPREVIGCGMFMLESYRDGERVVLKRNPNYFRFNAFGDRMPYVERIVYSIIQSSDLARDAFGNGQLDLTAVPGKDFKAMFRQQRTEGFTIYRRGPSTGTRFLVLNQNPRADAAGKPYVRPHKLAWFRDVRFRRALAHAIDREAIRDVIFNGQAYVQHSPVSEANTLFFTGDNRRFPEFPVVQYNFDLARARALLDEMDLRDRNGDGIREDDAGNAVEFVVNTYADSPDYAAIISLMREDLRKIGVKIDLVQLTFSGLVGRLMREFNWEGIMIGITGGFDDPMNGGRNVWTTSGDLHMWNPRQENASLPYDWELRINEIFSLAQRTPPYEERLRLAAEFQHIISREVPLIHTVNEAVNTAVYDRFDNFNPSVYSLVDVDMIFDRTLRERTPTPNP
jgi:peptide/nickel transport system substrate-binding protein